MPIVTARKSRFTRRAIAFGGIVVPDRTIPPEEVIQPLAVRNLYAMIAYRKANRG
jgi:hypothetical protein